MGVGWIAGQEVAFDLCRHSVASWVTQASFDPSDTAVFFVLGFCVFGAFVYGGPAHPSLYRCFLINSIWCVSAFQGSSLARWVIILGLRGSCHPVIIGAAGHQHLQET